MTSELKLLNVSISNVLAISKNMSIKQLNKIPTGFSNNLIWHIGHLVVTQKLLIYGLSNNKLDLEDDFVSEFRKGSMPEREYSKDECEKIILCLKDSYSQLSTDLSLGIFKNYKPYPTSYNFEITCLSDAISFNNLHFGLHVSTILRLKKILDE